MSLFSAHANTLRNSPMSWLGFKEISLHYLHVFKDKSEALNAIFSMGVSL